MSKELATELRLRIERGRAGGTSIGNLVDVWNFIDIHADTIISALERLEKLESQTVDIRQIDLSKGGRFPT